MSEITLKEMSEEVEKCFTLQEEYKAKKKMSTEADAAYRAQAAKVIGLLEEQDLSKFDTKLGTFNYRYDEKFQTPKTPETKEALFNHLKEKGIFEDMISVNSRTLNAWAKEEIIAADAMGVYDLQIPGLVKSEPMAVPVLRRSKV